MFEICVQQFSFTKRCWWQLSSLTQQIDAPPFTVKINLHKDDPFKELNDKLIKTFDPLLDLQVKIWKDIDFNFRGNTRNADLIEAKQPWVLFTDADMIFSTNLMAKLSQTHLAIDKVNVTPRVTMTDFTEGYILVDREEYENTPIKDAAEKLKNVTSLRANRSNGAGYFQLVNQKFLQDNNLTYCNEPNKVDEPLTAPGQYRTRSDVILRNKLGKRVLRLPPFYHLNHYRKDDQRFDHKVCR